ncbi:hypothetical protein IE53DRAFT_389722 [Violaceomyces palustris]|uniref:Uncharacterized protein n=1 Tax=Violaceomyces palustris TaxID=1673888 RepID=A0ACD0NQI4_9BASI|nr:hypothetical protein IE53DRAFT_389722 [Violaceomyces palustris]
MTGSIAPTRREILTLYRQYLTTAKSFSSYNFRTYFLRRSRDMFRSNLVLESSSNPSSSSASSPFSKSSAQAVRSSPSAMVSSSTPPPSSREEKVKLFYQQAVDDLKVLQRSALINRMYEGEKLVVEKPKLVVVGGAEGLNV